MASPPFNDMVVKPAERVFLCDEPGKPTVAVVLYSSDGTVTMANFDRNRATRLGRGLLDAAARR